MADYIYSISQDIPGGQFIGAIPAILNFLCRDLIPNDPLTAVNTADDVLVLSFQNSLSANEKTILDNNTQNPAGGLFERVNDNFQIIYQIGAKVETQAEVDAEPHPTSEDIANPTTTGQILLIPPDGIQTSTITLQYLNGMGQPSNGFGNRIELVAQNLLPVNKDLDFFDNNGQVSFIVGPSFDFGVVPVYIYVDYLPFQSFVVRFSSQGD